jgi:putative ATPase
MGELDMTLFDEATHRPLADALRPETLEEVIGQDHLLGENGPIARMLLPGGTVSSFILWGPPGVGKTTIARLVATSAKMEFVQLSAVMSGIADLRKVFETAKSNRTVGRQTILFIDELHRFNRSTQDALLPHVENGTVILIGATTENPSFSLVAALLSRLKVFTLNPFDAASSELLLARVENFVGKRLPLTEDARSSLINMADGDGRYLVGLADDVLSIGEEGDLDIARLSKALQKRMPIYDKAQDGHYNLLSCFHKSLRGSDVDAALYWGARMVEAGEDPTTLFRRLACAASEDVGMADPNAMPQVIAAWTAFERIGWPEGRLFIAQAIVYVATAPKSNASYRSFDTALEMARQTGSIPPPKNILNAPTKLMKDLGYHEGYKYDHDYPDAYSGQEFFPEELRSKDTRFYKPQERGFERETFKRLEFWHRLKRERSAKE